MKFLANAGASTAEVGDERLMIVAITGASGSGKSTLAQSLVKSRLGVASGPAACLLSLDAYYRDLSHLSLQEREAVNFDRIDAIELSFFCEHLLQLRSGGQIEVPRYDFSTHANRGPHWCAWSSAVSCRRWFASGGVGRSVFERRSYGFRRYTDVGLFPATIAKRLW